MNIYKINYELIKELIVNLARTTTIQASILVFLPGFEEIKRLNVILTTSKREFKQAIDVLLLHSSIDNDTQAKGLTRSIRLY
jgi:HrpA-like RNA helicase